MKFKKGDVVQLNSGGPQMTVTGIIGQDNELSMLVHQGFETGDVAVQYFVGSKLEKGIFKHSSLTVIENK